ncbi:glycosyltransferase family 39 protein [Candidatus Pacearchaeota archaeon]|nr:glycosyltransferase family 39 protein [Candidatus Pacearchaeota archaeon]
MTKSQAHWWDTLAYGAIAKESVYHLWTGTHFIVSESIIRAPLLPFVWSLFMRLNLSEVWVLIFLEYLPSLASVYLVYLIGKEMYNEKIGLISAFVMSVLWINIFYTARIMTDIPSSFLVLLSIYCFFKSYENFNLKYFSISIFSISLAILMRNSSFLIGATYIVFLVLIKKHKLFKEKNFWIGGIIGAIPLIFFFLSNFLTKGDFFPALGSYASSAAAKSSYAYYIIDQFFPHLFPSLFKSNYSTILNILKGNPFSIFGNILLTLFAIGLIIAILELFLSKGYIFKLKRTKSHIFSLLLLILSLAFFIFYIKAAEDRYLLIIITSLLFFSAIGLTYIYDKIKKYNKNIAVVFLVIVLALSAYSQYSYGHPIIESKIPSYYNLKQAFVWVNENTPENAVVLGDGIDPYVIYYGNRKFEHWNFTDIESTLKNSDYIVVAAWEHQGQQSMEFINGNLSNRLSLEQVFFFDQQQKQVSAMVYKIKK